MALIVHRLAVIVAVGTVCLAMMQVKQPVSEREQKYLKLFAVVKIPNFVCQNTTGGVCVSNKDCGRLGGSNVGNCADGYGICCLVVYNCTNSPETVTVNGSHLQSPPRLSAPNSCEYILQRPDGVCQVRLDFNKFETSDGSLNGDLTGDCDQDMLIISGASNANGLGMLCGNLTGQHMYLDYGNSNNIDLMINTLLMMNQNWDIQVTYIKCDSLERAPDGCLQYFTTASGTVMSFNFANMYQKNDEDYTICVKPLPGMTSITWQQCSGFGDFFIGGMAPIMSPDPSLFPDIVNPVQGDNCSMDWFMISGVDKFCGNYFQGSVTSMSQPFVVNVHFDGQELPDDDRNAGFCMMWMQGR